MPLSPAELEPLLRLSLVQGIGPGRVAQLLDRFGSAEDALSARPAELRSVPGIGVELARRIGAASGRQGAAEARRALRRLAAMDAVALIRDDPLFPDPFRRLPDPPFLLFAAGDLDLMAHTSVAIVGTRSPTIYGREAARTFARDLSSAGFAIVSGMARGIDTAAHLGALDASGATVGVLGHGIEQVYPPENRRLFSRVRERGLLLTEYPPGETPRAGNFPKRNRLITALTEAVLVVEMGHRSGAQHTVDFALEQGKEVLAVPGPVGSPPSAGTNQLIRDGAGLATCAEDVIEEIRGVGAPGCGGRSGIPAPDRAATDVSDALPLFDAAEATVMQALSDAPAHLDELATRTDLQAAVILATLLQLELRELVTALPGMRFRRR